MSTRTAEVIESMSDGPADDWGDDSEGDRGAPSGETGEGGEMVRNPDGGQRHLDNLETHA